MTRLHENLLAASGGHNEQDPEAEGLRVLFVENLQSLIQGDQYLLRPADAGFLHVFPRLLLEL
jgi:hypothetical protein